MRIISFIDQRGPALGLVHDTSEVIDVSALDARAPRTLGALLRAGPERCEELLRRAADNRPTLELARLSLLPAVPDPHAIWAIALNYPGHIAEGGHRRPDHPMMFLRLPISLVGHCEPLIRPADSAQFDYEGELAVVIGRRCFQVDAAAVPEFVLGYACCNEGSVREWQRHTTQITPGKNFVASGSFGPWLVTRDEIPDIYAQSLVTRVNGAEMQRARLDEMLFRIEDIISYVSHIAPLLPGDVILTGTPGGVGFRRTPQRFLRAGDLLEIEIGDVGTLRNPVVDGRSAHANDLVAPELAVATRLATLLGPNSG